MAKSLENDLLLETEFCFKEDEEVFTASVTLLWEDIRLVEEFKHKGDWKHLSSKSKTCLRLTDDSRLVILESYQKFRNQWVAVRAKMNKKTFWTGSFN